MATTAPKWMNPDSDPQIGVYPDRGVWAVYLHEGLRRSFITCSRQRAAAIALGKEHAAESGLTLVVYDQSGHAEVVVD